MNFITNDQVPEIEIFQSSPAEVMGQSAPQVLLHDSVFVKIDKAANLFNVMILKTNQTIPYSSVFIELEHAPPVSPNKRKCLLKILEQLVFVNIETMFLPLII